MHLSKKRETKVKVQVLKSAARFLVLKVEVLRIGAIIETTFILVIIIDRKVVKTKASFLSFETVDT